MNKKLLNKLIKMIKLNYDYQCAILEAIMKTDFEKDRIPLIDMIDSLEYQYDYIKKLVQSQLED